MCGYSILAAYGVFARSGRLVMECVGAFDGMVAHIDRPTLKNPAAPLSYKNRKKYYIINMQAIAECDMKFVWWSIRSAGSIHDNLTWGTTRLAMLPEEFGLPLGL